MYVSFILVEENKTKNSGNKYSLISEWKYVCKQIACIAFTVKEHMMVNPGAMISLWIHQVIW